MAEMVSESSATPPEWEAELLRFTAFVDTNGQEFNPSWWEAICGRPPESTIAKPTAGEFQAEGKVSEKARLVLTISPGRIDWLLALPTNLNDSADSIPTIGNLPESLALFSSFTDKWIPSCPKAHRLAFGATLLLPCSNKESGYERLSSLLPSVKIDPHGSENLAYQINRPRALAIGVPNLKVNRLSKWSVASKKMVKYLFNPDPRIRTGSFHGPERLVCVLELDINTSPEFQSYFDAPAARAVLAELTKYAIEISEKGDLP